MRGCQESELMEGLSRSSCGQKPRAEVWVGPGGWCRSILDA